MRRITLAALVLALAGCGGGNGDDTPGETGAATTDVARTGTISPETGTTGETETETETETEDD